MKKSAILLIASLMAGTTAVAQNRANITLNNGEVHSYPTSGLSSIDFDETGFTVNPLTGESVRYTSGVTSLSFIKSAEGHVTLREAGGWFESAYVKWDNMGAAQNYYVYVKPYGGTYSRIDKELVRNYGAYGRADVPGLVAGQYTLKVVPVVGGTEREDLASETPSLTVAAHDRSGFAHFNRTEGIGAYNLDGSLKTGAKVIYVNADNAKTVTTVVKTGKKDTNVTECTGLQTIIDAYQKGYDDTPIVFRIIGRITLSDLDHISSSAEGLQVKGRNSYSPLEITIEGVGDDAVFHGFGILLRNASSVEVSNLAFMWFMDDGVSLDTDNSHCWIHNCDFFYGQRGGDSDQAKGDGSLDIKGDSQYLTISYNHFWDSGKSSLCGMKSESGPNYLTYHHNWFDHSDSRHPRIRTMSVHVYNNYFDGVAKYGVGSTMGSDVFVENNYFRDCKNPVMTSLQGTDIASDGTGTFSGEQGGSIKMYGNVLCGKYTFRPWSETNQTEYDAWVAPSRDAKMPASVVAKSGGATYSNWDTDPSLIYDYTPHAAAEVPGVVKGIYGAGRCNHGDFHWTFNNNIQDTNYDVISALSNAIAAYDSWLVGYYEGDTSIGNGGVGSNNPGGDATEGDEFPFGNYNTVGGSAPDPGVEITPDDYFITNGNGGYFTFGPENATQVNQWISEGIFNGGSYMPTFTNDTYFSGGQGAYQIVKSSSLVIKCPSIKVLKAKLLRTGTFAGTVAISTNGSNYTDIGTISGSKGLREFDWSAAAKTDGPVYVKITNTSSGTLNIVGLCIIK